MNLFRFGKGNTKAHAQRIRMGTHPRTLSKNSCQKNHREDGIEHAELEIDMTILQVTSKINQSSRIMQVMYPT